MGMIYWLENWLQNDDTTLIYILTLILIANLIDFGVGWFKARFYEEIKFSSAKAILGMARKIVVFILLVVFIPFSLLIPNVGISALYILYMGYLTTEFFSILRHLGFNLDDKNNMFTIFLNNIIKGESKNE